MVRCKVPQKRGDYIMLPTLRVARLNRILSTNFMFLNKILQTISYSMAPIEYRRMTSAGREAF